MSLRQLTTEVRNRLQLTAEVPADEKRKKKKIPRHLSAKELISNFFLKILYYAMHNSITWQHYRS